MCEDQMRKRGEWKQREQEVAILGVQVRYGGSQNEGISWTEAEPRHGEKWVDLRALKGQIGSNRNSC